MLHMIARNLLLLFILSYGGFAVASAAENRVALIIGNSAYQHAPGLNNPRNDASDIAAAVEKLGFKVIKGIDLDKSGMDRTIRRFAQELKGAAIGIFFYAGHGLQVSGKNYLVPIDAQLKANDALDFEMIGLDVVQRIMEAASDTNLLFVDACRDNPLSRNLAQAMGTRSAAIGRGLVAQEAGAGTLISFSTQPGNVALDGTGNRNSPYAAALRKHITTSGKDLPALLIQVRREVMAATDKRQVPWEHSALTAEVVLAPEGRVQAALKAAPGGGDARTESKPDIRAQPPTNKTADLPMETRRQSVIKVAKPGVFTLTNSLHDQSLYDESGTHRIMQGINGSKELPEGKYHLQDGRTHHMSTKLFEIKSGEKVDINQISGFVTVKNARNNQHIYDETGTRRLSSFPFDDGIHLPPGRYFLQDSHTHHMSTKSFEVKAGQTLDINQVSGLLTLRGAKNAQHVYDETGTARLTSFPFQDGVHLPPGRYRVIDSTTNFTTVETLDVKAGEEIVVDLGG
jgi:hypothetical protein